MRTLVALLILLSISFNAQADHEEIIELDSHNIQSNKIYLSVYNKSSTDINPLNFYWLVTFDDDIKRIYRTTGSLGTVTCMKYSDCLWYIEINKQGANKIAFTHID